MGGDAHEIAIKLSLNTTAGSQYISDAIYFLTVMRLLLHWMTVLAGIKHGYTHVTGNAYTRFPIPPRTKQILNRPGETTGLYRTPIYTHPS